MQEVERVNKNFKIIWNGVNNVKCFGLPHIVSVLNGHMPLGGEQVVFGLAHTSLLVNVI
jgi:hypothetical protein